MLESKRRIANFSTACTLALGFGTLVMFVFAGLSMFKATALSTPRASAMLSKDGEVMVMHMQMGSRYEQEYRDLDGNVITNPEVYSAEHYAFYNLKSALTNYGPRHWSQRISAFKVGNAYWYLVRSATGDDAYFVGYEKNRGVTGYLSANGYQTSQPAGDELIQISPASDDAFLTTEWPYVNTGRMYERSTVFLAARDRILKIDLRNRTVKQFADVQDAIAIGLSLSQTGTTVSEGKSGLAARDAENIYMFDGEGQQVASVPHAPNKDSHTLAVYTELEDQIAVGATTYKTNKFSQDFYWYEKEGANKLLRTESFDLNNGVELGLLEYVAATVSSPLAAYYMPTFWGIASTCILPSLLAVFVWRNEESNQSKVFWALFTFFLGLSGFLGYWFHRKRKETLISCLQCSVFLPKLSTKCDSCQEPLPFPPRLGTEIFA